MNSELKTKWIEALRSGKYEQGNGKLRFDGKYCCLGVLCEVAGVDEEALTWSFPPETDLASFDLNEKIAWSLAFANDGNIGTSRIVADGFVEGQQTPFPVLADYIEANL